MRTKPIDLEISCLLDPSNLRWPVPKSGKPAPPWVRNHPGVQNTLHQLGRKVAQIVEPEVEYGPGGIVVRVRVSVGVDPGDIECHAERLITNAQNVADELLRQARAWAEQTREEARRERAAVASDLRDLWESFRSYDECAGRR